MAPRKVPWWRTDADADESDKIVGLPNDSARWAWFRVGCKAKLARHMGVFPSPWRAYLRHHIGPYARHVPALITAGLVHEWPTDCARCVEDYSDDATDGALVVHDYRRKQVDPTAADRQAKHYAKGQGADDAHGVPHGDAHGEITFSSRALSRSPSMSSSQTTNQEPYQVAAGPPTPLDAMALVEEITGRPFGWGPGSPLYETLAADIADLGFERVTTEYRSVKADAQRAGSPIDVAGVVYGAHKRLYRIPDTPRSDRARSGRGYGPSKEDVDGAII